MSGVVNHPAADLFPIMGVEELAALAEDIRVNGQRVPIIRDGEGRIVDGRNRLAACELAGVEPVYTDLNGADPLDTSISMNVKRRNLTAGQRAIAAAESYDVAVFPKSLGKQGKADHVGPLFAVAGGLDGLLRDVAQHEGVDLRA